MGLRAHATPGSAERGQAGRGGGGTMSFVSLQALRGLAALGVVLFHLLPFEAKYLPGAPIVPPGFSAGRAGVDLFFVFSGFLAVWTRVVPRGPAPPRASCCGG